MLQAYWYNYLVSLTVNNFTVRLESDKMFKETMELWERVCKEDDTFSFLLDAMIQAHKDAAMFHLSAGDSMESRYSILHPHE